MWDYTEKVKEYYMNPINIGEMEDADAVGEVGSLTCGDAMKLFLKIKDGVIIDAKFLTFGCGSAIASGCALTEMIKGKTIEEAEKISNNDIVEFLGGLPSQKIHCSVMGKEALDAVFADYRGDPQKEEKIICQCFSVSEDKIRHEIRENKISSVEDVTNYTKAGGRCQMCLHAVGEILVQELKKRE